MKKSLFLFRSQHHDHLAAFELGLMFNLSHFGELRADAVHQLHAELLVSHFTAAVAQRDLGLVAVIEESHQGAELRLEVVFVRHRAELHFLDLNHLLLGLGSLSLLMFLLTELAVVHQAADRRLGVRRDLNEVNVGVLSHAQGFRSADNADLGAIDAGQSDLRNSDLTVDPMLAILCYDNLLNR